MRRSIQQAGFEHRSHRNKMGLVRKIYAIKTTEMTELMPMGMSRAGFYTMPGFTASVDLGEAQGEQVPLDEW